MKNKTDNTISQLGWTKSTYGDYFINSRNDRKIYTNGASVWDNKGNKRSNPTSSTLLKFL